MKQETDLQALQLEVDEVLRGLASMQHLLQRASRVQRTENIERTEATFWVDGQPARPLASFLHPLQAALRLSLVDAAGELLAPVIERDGAPLLVLHPVMPVERLAAYARLRGAYRGWGIARNHSYACDDGQPANGLRLNLGPVPPTAEEAARALADAARGAADALAKYWLDCLKAGCVDRLDSPPGLPAGAVLGVTEADAQWLWPQLPSEQAEASSARAAPAVLQPIGGAWPHIKRAKWTEEERAALFLMRHRDKKTGEELAKIAGVSRQAIDEVIGRERPPGGLGSIVAESWGWRPSAELLAQCGVPLQPLQSAAMLLSAS